MFAAGVRKKTPEKENATEFIGQIDPATLISIIRVQNEQKNQIPEPLVDPLPDIERRQKKKSKKQRKRQQKVRNQESLWFLKSIKHVSNYIQ
jgi:transposase